MKRLLSLLSFVCLFVVGVYPMAYELNIYASGLRVNSVNAETNEVSINYFLNCQADALEFQLINSTGVVKTVAITGSGNLTKGQHNNVTINLSDVTIGGSYKWALKATRESVNSYTKVTDSSTPYQFWGGRGVAVDNSFESNYFGNIYVTNFNLSEGAGDYISRLTQTGVYALDAGLNMINENAYQGGLTWGDNSGIQWAIARPCVGPDGTVYISVGSSTNSGVWMMNPADPSIFTAVFGGTHSATGTTKQGGTIIHNSILHCYVEGERASRKLYTYDLTTASNGGDIFRYDIGTLASPWTSAPSATIYSDADNSNKIQGGDCSIAPDGNGGWWICQYRSGTGSASIPCLIHTTQGTIDYNSGTTIKTTQQGGLAVSKDGRTLAIGTDKSNIVIYDVVYAANNTPTLTKRTTIGWDTGRNAKGLAFDVANNLYVVDNAKEMFAAFATRGAGEFTTPAPSSQKISISRPLAGTYKVGGTQANYVSLYDAVADISSLGISGDVNLLICSDLTEAQNIGLVNTSAYTITIKPDADADRTITFTQTSDNGGPSGAFIIGAPFGIANMTAVNTANITIDGLATAEATHKMKLEVSSSFGSNAGVVVFYGGITNTTLKNCKVVNNLNGNSYRAHCVAIRSTASAYPNGVVLENNEISSVDAGYGCPIYINGSASTSNPPRNTIIRNNDIAGKRDAILFNYCNNITIENNIIRIKGSNGVLGKGIGYYTDNTTQSAGNIIIRRNKFLELVTNNGYDGNYGFIAIEAMSPGDWVIENNLFTGFDAKTNTRKGHLIGIKTGSKPSSITIRHNTMYMPAFSHTMTNSLLSANPVSLIYIAAGSPVIKNNIFVSKETACVNSLIRGALNANCINNIFYHAGSNAYVVDGAASAQEFTDLPTSPTNYQSTNKWQQVELETGSYIPTTAYLNNINLAVPHLDGFNYDIEGNTRNTPTRAGCYDPAWEITLDQTANNDALLTDFDNIMVNATLNRSFADDGWYTLVLPFDANAEQLTEAFGAGYQVAELQESYWKNEEHTDMYLRFNMQSNIHAGVPCLFKMGEGKSCSSVNFSDVTIDKSVNDVETELMDMKGMYKPTEVDYLDNNYYLGTEDLLYPYTSTFTTNGFRAYFHLNFDMSGMQAPVRARVIFHDQVATDIEDLPEPAAAPAAQKVLRDGQLIIIRDGKEYNVQGELVR